MPLSLALPSPALPRVPRMVDVVVVGSGVAGSLVAWELARSGAQVVLLEAGQRVDRAQLQAAAQRGEALETHLPAIPVLESEPWGLRSLRVVGGTTWQWSGSAWRLTPADFKLRSRYGVGRDWPLSYEVLEPYYQRAEELMGVAGPGGAALGSPRSLPYPMESPALSWMDQRLAERLHEGGWVTVPVPAARNSRPYDRRAACCGDNRCDELCGTGALYHAATHAARAEQAGALLLPGTPVTFIEADDRGLVRAVHARRPDGSALRVAARAFVLAANAIETPKLMLLSTSEPFPRGIGNRSGALGRGLMSAPVLRMQMQVDEALWPGRGPVEMSALPAWRDGPFRSTASAALLRWSNRAATPEVARELVGQGLRGTELMEAIRDRSARQLRLEAQLEPLPLPEARVLPSAAQRDPASGLPLAELRLAQDAYVQRGAQRVRAEFQRIAAALGARALHIEPRLQPSHDVAGTCVMGEDGQDAVVDAQCRVHDHPNLFVAGAAVMPSIGCVPVTLTVAALACRLAEHLKLELGAVRGLGA